MVPMNGSDKKLLMASVTGLMACLQEWLNTPFFDSKEKWERWVDGFRGKVQTTITFADIVLERAKNNVPHEEGCDCSYCMNL